MADSQDAIELRRRARRRLVGAIALVVFMVIALPIVLDREPKPVSQELTIQIPSQDAGRFASRVPPPEPPPASVIPTPAPSAGGPASPVTITPLAAPGEASPAKSDKGGKPETARSEPAAVKPRPEAAPAAVTRIDKPVAAASPATRETKAEPAKSETTRVEAPKLEARVEPGKTEAPKTEAPRAEAPRAEAPRAEAPKTEPVKADAGYVVPLGLFSKPDNIKQVRGKASAAGIKTFTEALAGSDRVRVRAGPFPTRDAAEKAREKLKAAGLDVGAVAAR